MNVDNVKSQMRKGMLEYCILLLLHRVCLFFRHYPEAERGPADCGGRHALSVADPPEERRTPVVRVGGVHARTAPQVLWTDSGRGGISERTGKCLGRTFRHGESFKTKHLKIT